MIQNIIVEEVRDDDHENTSPKIPFFPEGGRPITMSAITFALIGFMAGLFTMAMISLYKYVIKIMSN